MANVNDILASDRKKDIESFPMNRNSILVKIGRESCADCHSLRSFDIPSSAGESGRTVSENVSLSTEIFDDALEN
jgi:hypothetical protein